MRKPPHNLTFEMLFGAHQLYKQVSIQNFLVLWGYKHSHNKKYQRLCKIVNYPHFVQNNDLAQFLVNSLRSSRSQRSHLLYNPLISVGLELSTLYCSLRCSFGISWSNPNLPKKWMRKVKYMKKRIEFSFLTFKLYI